MRATQSLDSWIPGQFQSNTVFGPQFLQFGHDTIGDQRITFGQKTVHHTFHDVDFLLNREVDKIGIDQHLVWGFDSFVVLEEQSTGHLWDISS